jgi:hypothetical protein
LQETEVCQVATSFATSPVGKIIPPHNSESGKSDITHNHKPNITSTTMAPPNRTKQKPKGSIAAATKPDKPVSVNPAAANDTAVATGGATKCSHWEHGTPANTTANNKPESNPPTAVAVHPATANGANVPSKGDMVTTIGGSDSNEYDDLTILSSLSPPLPVAVEAPPLSLNLLDGKISASNTTDDGEITRVVEHVAYTNGQVETILDTAMNVGVTTTNPLPPDQVLGYHWLKVDVMVDRVNTSPTMHTAKTTCGVETTMDDAINAGGTATHPLPPDSDSPQKLNNTSSTKICPSNTNTQTITTK